MKILHLKTSLFGDHGQSAQLAEEFLRLWRAQHRAGSVVTRDLAAAPLPHLDGERFGAFLAAPEQRSVAQQAIVAESDVLIEELRAADELLIGMPMYNFAAPTQFKVWIDHIARAGVSFRYTENGPVGLLGAESAAQASEQGLAQIRALFAGSAAA
jgi:FMN-dependent NADH-azoreductase